MRHVTSLPVRDAGEAPVSRRRSARILASTLTAALAMGGLAVGAAAPASAAVTDTVTGYSLSWGFQTGANGWRIEAEGADLINPVTVTTSITQAALATPFTSSSGFVLTDGQGAIDSSTSEGTISFDSDIRYYPQASYGALVPDQPWVDFSDFELTTTSATRGTLTAVVDWYKNATTELATPTRVEIANFDITSLELDGDQVELTSAAPDWTNAVPAGTYAAGYSDAWPAELNNLFLPKLATGENISIYFHRTGATAGNNAKAPVALSLTSDLVAPSVDATVTAANPKDGATVAVSGDGFRGVTNAGDTGIYVGIAPAGGLPDVTTRDGSAAFAVANFLPAGLLSAGTFATTLSVPSASIDPAVSYSVYTWQAHTHSNTTQDTETPITFDAASLTWLASSATVTPSASSVVPGAAVTLTAAVPAGATGTVEFFDGTTSLGSSAVAAGSASISVSTLAIGAHAISAVYSGDNYYPTVTSAAASVTVDPSASSVTTRISKTAAFGTIRTIKAIVSPTAEGTVTFTEGATILGTSAVVSGVATLKTSTLSVGSHKVTATFSGSATTSAASAVVTVKVTKLSAKTTVAAKKFAKNTKPKVTVKVAKLANGKYATGKVRVYVAGKSVKLVTLKASDKGKVTVTLPKKYSKTINVKAKYFGSTTVAVKTSSTLKLRVK